MSPTEIVAVLDMDGVILKTNLTKHRAMLALFSSFPGHTERISQYILDRNGVRRDLKILGIHAEILGSTLTEDELNGYLDRYAIALEKELSVAPLVDGVDRFVQDHPGRLFVSSSAPTEEVERQLSVRSLVQHFDGVFAGEADKRQGLERIRVLAGSQTVVFFGDSLGDWESARSADIAFVGVIAERDNFRDAPIAKIRDFVDRDSIAKAIERSLA
jgi:beta-phosphoglucomutase-like phosphatase (HAD superfamily)